MKKTVLRSLSVLLILLLLAGCSPKSKDSAVNDQWVEGDQQVQVIPGETPEDTTPNHQGDPSVTPPPSNDKGNTNTPTNQPTNTPTGSDPDNSYVPEGEFCLWVSPVSGQAADGMPFHAVKWQYLSHQGSYFLFCPTEGDVEKMQLWIQGAPSCTIKGKTYQNGDVISLTALAGKGAVDLTANGDTYSLAVLKSANIGSLYIKTVSGNMDYIHQEKGNEETGLMRMVDAAGKELYSGNLTEFKGRGNSTWKRDKKGYQFKVENKAELVAGAGEGRTWVLLANYGEKTLVRNTVALDLMYDVGMKETARSAHVDLYCNGEYMGNYLLSEKVQVAENRITTNNLDKANQEVNAAELKSYPTFGKMDATKAGSKKGYDLRNDPADITGTYLLEIDMPERYVEEKCGFVTDRGKCVVIKEPEYASRAQVEYIANYFQEFEDAVFATDGINPKTGKRFDQYFDLTSLARKYILEELVKNFDADKTSQYYYKPSDKDSKVGYCGPAWDYDNAFDNFKPAAKNQGMYAANNQKYLYYNLCKKDIFMDAVAKEWKNNFLPLIKMCVGDGGSPKGSLKPLSTYYKELSPSAKMNFTLWDILDTPIFESTYVDTGSTYKEHYEYLDRYITDRAAYLSGEWLK